MKPALPPLPFLPAPDTARPLYPVAAIRAAEQAAAATLAPGTLMECAARAAAELALAMLAQQPQRTAAPVLVLAGPGNNGGDALLCARHLQDAGLAVTLALCADPQAYRGEAAQAWQAACTLPRIEGAIADGWALVIDGLFGIGLARAAQGRARELIEQVNRLACPVLALDVPSGLDADSGAMPGGGPAIRASATLTFIGDKPGLHTGAGGDHAGRVHVAGLDIAAALLPAITLRLNAPALFAAQLTARAQDSHKGVFGQVAVLGGADGMAGASVLAARAAQCGGAGRVFAGFVGSVPSYDPLHPELMCRAADALDYEDATLVAGPGLSTTAAARALLVRAIASPQALLLDADALNLVAADTALQAQVAARSGTTLLTPHPLEAARLLNIAASQVQAARIECARRLAAQFRAVVVLKGFGSVIAGPDGEAVINPSGNPGLASAGSGDVLSGLGGALLAQRWPLWQAALGAVWLHGAAAERLVEAGIGPIGLCASELPAAVRAELNRLVRQRAAGAEN